jgi:pepF/M3 family oligoendopeptidase
VAIEKALAMPERGEPVDRRGDSDGARERLPRWDISPIYVDFDAPAYIASKKRLGELAAAMERLFASLADLPVADWLAKALALEDEAMATYSTVSSYAYARHSTSTQDGRGLSEINAVEELGLPLERMAVLFRNALAAHRPEVLAAAADDPRVAPFAFHLEEELLFQSRQMPPELEDLAADLSRSGADAWSRLQSAVASNTDTLWDERTGERKTIVELRSLAYDADPAARERAFRLELDAWKGVEIPMAAALNGVKGSAAVLDGRRGWNGPLDKALAQSRITRKALASLIGAMEESLPAFRRYLKLKARLLGRKALPFCDLFAPIVLPGAKQKKYGWAEARSFIVGKFGSFDPAMGAFAARAFDEGWIDAEPRLGKVGGAYCTHFPLAKASRVLCNFGGTISDLSALAHELGHAWHYECVKDKPSPLADYPMTLAETASIFAETFVFESALAEASPETRLPLLEARLQDSCQVIVDILSRFYFELAVSERRASGELSPEDLCRLMVEAERRSYGDGLDPDRLHPYMWAVKDHYYIPDLAFYNFPYAFGLLVGLALYARYRAEGPAFAAAYRGFLAASGSASAVDVARMAGFDIEAPAFWKGGLEVIAGQVEEFGRLAAGLVSP